jgi:pimeloyl-ACP methyl ester carboxylesterase
MSKPTIVMVPGLWEGTDPFSAVSTMLQSHSYPVTFAPLASTGKPSPGNPSMDDDVAAIRAVLAQLVEEKHQSVLLVCHSAGGFLGPSAMEGLVKSHREKSGLEGGVVGIVFLAGAVAPEGYMHTPRPFMDFSLAEEKGEMWCKDVRGSLFNDFSEADAEKWIAKLNCQPSSGWDLETKYAGWREVETTYLVCENDQVLPSQVQEQMAGLAGSAIVKCGAGHMVQITMPEKVVEIIRKAAREVV